MSEIMTPQEVFEFIHNHPNWSEDQQIAAKTAYLEYLRLLGIHNQTSSENLRRQNFKDRLEKLGLKV